MNIIQSKATDFWLWHQNKSYINNFLKLTIKIKKDNSQNVV